MSCTETHFGKFIVRARGWKAIREYCDEHNIPYDTWKNDEAIELVFYESRDPNWIEKSRNRKYDIIYKYRKNEPDENILIEYLEHKSFDDDSPGFAYFKHYDDGSLGFAIQFYNGGTCEQEVLGDFEEDRGEFTIL